MHHFRIFLSSMGAAIAPSCNVTSIYLDWFDLPHWKCPTKECQEQICSLSTNKYFDASQQQRYRYTVFSINTIIYYITEAPSDLILPNIWADDIIYKECTCKAPGDQVYQCNFLLWTWSPGALQGHVFETPSVGQ
jgi:hypothetical protein